jgi:hypothetical protein
MCGGKPPKQKAMQQVTQPYTPAEPVDDPIAAAAADPELDLKKKGRRGRDNEMNILTGPKGIVKSGKTSISSQSLLGA